jgi:nucleoside-diphosphate-sugar epimerase
MLQGQRILLTGLTGRVGGAFAQAFAGANELWGLARYSQAGQREHWEKAGVKTIVGHYADDDLSAVPNDFDYVLHVAADVAPKTFEQGMRDNAEGVGLLMAHCRSAKAFLHVSTVGVYAANSDFEHRYGEDDVTGSGSMGHYCGTKLAGEGAARAMARHLNLKTVICRLAVQYGTVQGGGMPGAFLKKLLAGETILLPRDQSNIYALVCDQDLVDFVEPCLAAASVPATTVNWGGDIAVPGSEFIEYLAGLAGVEARYDYYDGTSPPSVPTDNRRRIEITGPCKVHWRDGLKTIYEAIHERLRAEVAAGR